MWTNARKWLILAVLLSLGLSLGGAFSVPSPTYAAQEPPLQATAEQLESIEALSAAFRAVAKAVRPSVVSIRVTKYPPHRRTEDFEFGAPGPPAQRRSPEEYDELRRRLREFFGPDFDFFGPRVVPKKIRPRRPTRGLGSGVIVDAKKGYILTNYHVIEGADEIQVKLHNGYRYGAKELGHDARADLAIVEIDAPDLQQARLGSSAQAEPGDIVLAIGSPWGLDQTVTQGIISAKGRSIGSLLDPRISDAVAIQTDAAVNPGNSGGPLVNIHGEVIGINRAIRPQGALAPSYAGVVFAVPIDHAKKVMEHIISGEPLKRGYLGVFMRDLADVDSALLKSLAVEHRPGVMVLKLPAGQPAHKAGLEAGDVILAVDGQTITDSATLQRTIAANPPRSQVVLTIWRNKKTMEIPVELGEQTPDEQLTALAPERQAPATIEKIEKMGLQISELTPEKAKQIGLPADTEGLLVEKVQRDGLAHQLGLQPNDVITKLQQQRVRTIEDFNDVLTDLSLAEGISVTAVNKSGNKFSYRRSPQN